jgi:P27 family predicted phage terminase small subunit
MALVALPGGGGDVPMPEWDTIFTDELLQARAADVWRSTVSEMRDAGTLAAINGNQIRRYVVACVMFDDATAKIAEHGPVTKGKRSAMPTWNPWWTVLKDCDVMASNHEDKLGLNPRRRAQVAPVKKKARAATSADRFLAAKA